MKDLLLYPLFVILYLSIRSTLLVAIPSPDLSLVIVVYIALVKPSVKGLITSFAIGYLNDVFSGGVIGITSFSLVIVFIASHFLSRWINLHDTLTKSIVIAILTLAKGVIVYLLLWFINNDISSITLVIPIAVVTGLLAVPITNLLNKMDRIMVPKNKDIAAV